MKLLEDRITANFRLSEFANNADGGAVMLNPAVLEFVWVLQKYRDWYNRPINVTSGYRTPAYNKKVGGAPNSYHLRGLAVDFLLPPEWHTFTSTRKSEFIGNVKNKWYELCGSVSRCGSVIIYDSFMHLSFWPVPYFEDKRTRKF